MKAIYSTVQNYLNTCYFFFSFFFRQTAETTMVLGRGVK